MTENEAISMTTDLVKFLTLIIVVHLLSYAIDNDDQLFSEKILKKLLYVTLGIIIYNLIVKKWLIPKKKN